MSLFDKAKLIEDKKNPYSKCYLYGNSIFYIEPVFSLKLIELSKRINEEEYQRVLEEMERIIKNNQYVVFSNEEDEEITLCDNAIYLTIQDVLNPLKIYLEDKSRGSDYGD